LVVFCVEKAALYLMIIDILSGEQAISGMSPLKTVH
jgi:hypothetical protein